jgi:hypothetical protein
MTSSEVSGLVEHMVSMPSHTLSPEQLWEALAFRNARFRDHLVAILWLADDKLANLSHC